MANYIIYDKLSPLLSNRPFLAGKTLLNNLYIANQNIEDANEALNFNLFALNKGAFVKNYSRLLVDVSNNNETIITLDDNSYLYLENVKKILENKKDTIDELTCKNLCEIVHVNNVLMQEEWIKQIKKDVKHTFEGFCAGFYIGNDVEKNLYKNEKIDELFNIINLKRIKMNFDYYPSGYDIFESGNEIAKKIAAKILFDAFDNSADFLIVNDIRTFTFFDSCQKKIAKVFGRDINLPILTLSQVILLSLGVTDKNILGFNKHFIKPTFV